MERKQIYVCKKCHSFYSANHERAIEGCPECGGEFVCVPVGFNKFSSMSEQEKEQFKADFLANNDLERLSSCAMAQSAAENDQVYHFFVSTASGWVRGMKFANKLFFGVFIVAAVLAFSILLPNPLLAILASAAIFCLGFLCVGMSMVFLDMAADIKAIRDHINHQQM